MTTTTQTETHVRTTYRDHVAWLRFDGSRPFDGAFWTQLHEAVRSVEGTSARALVLSSESSAFSVGNSAPWLSRTVGAAARREDPDTALYTAGEQMRRVAHALHALTIPSVALVAGPVIGAGVELACVCDLRICIDPVVLTLPEAHLGVLPDLAPLDILDDVLGVRPTRRMLLTGRPERLDPASTASFADHWVPTDTAARTMVTSLAVDFPVGPVLPALRRAGERDAAIERAGIQNTTLSTAADFRDAVARLVERTPRHDRPVHRRRVSSGGA